MFIHMVCGGNSTLRMAWSRPYNFGVGLRRARLMNSSILLRIARVNGFWRVWDGDVWWSGLPSIYAVYIPFRPEAITDA